jgi:copper transport protein
VLVASDPSAGTRVDRAPRLVTLTFDEPVETSIGSLRVFDDKGHSRTAGRVFHPGGDPRIIAARIEGLEHGRFVVSWQVVSADSHIVDGAFAFGFGVRAGEAPVFTRDPASTSLLMIVHGLILASAVLGIGLAISGAMLETRMPAGSRDVQLGAWITLASFALCDVLLRADITSGSPAAVFATRVGMLRAVTITAASAALVLTAAVAGKQRHLPLLATALVAASSLSLAGHAAVGSSAGVGVVADLLHLLAAAAWIGVLATAVTLPSDDDVRIVAPVAGIAVVAIVITGIVQTVRNVGSFAPIVSTAYGIAIDLKVGLLALTLLAALGARQALKRDRHKFRNRLRFELLLLTGIIAVTAVLVETPLPREAAALRVATAAFPVSDVTVYVTATQADPRHWAVRVDGTDADGTRRALDDAHVTLRDADRRSGPLVVPLRRDVSGAFVGDAVLPWPGRWSALVSARVGEFEEGHRTLSLQEARP